MMSKNLAMSYPRHNILVICDWINLVLALGIVGVGAYRTWGITSGFINRMDIVVITAGAKSIVFLLYILSTSCISSLKRFYNATTIFVMAIIDTVLWAAALGMTAYGMIQIPPSGLRETLSYVLIALIAVTLVFSFYVLYLASRQRQYVKAAKKDGEVQQYRADPEGYNGYK